MPRSFRWTLKRELERAINDIHKAQVRIDGVAKEYKDDYPEYWEPLALVIVTLEKMKEALKNVKDAI